MKIDLIHGNCLEEMKNIPDGSIDLVLTDPPYELGFMGKKWDSSGITNNVNVWKECLRVLKPGGYVFSFGGTRTYHRMACAIEDAGFEVRDMIEYVYGSGFPKSHNIGKNVEKIKVGGIKNLKKIGTKKGIKVETGTQGFSYSKEYVAGKSMGGKQISGDIPVYEINNEWEGWGTALKPAHEPICMARKPLSEKNVALNCLKWGTGGINIDGSRVETSEEDAKKDREWKEKYANGKYTELGWKNTSKAGLVSEIKHGRFPANLLHDNSEEVRECFPSESGRFFKSIIYQAKASKKDRGEGNTHATVKPTALMEYLINMASRKGSVILDPFMGSGTTGVACKKLNRNFIGIELEKEYFDIAKKRIDETNTTSHS